MTFYITTHNNEVIDTDNPQETQKRWINYLREYGPILPKENEMKRLKAESVAGDRGNDAALKGESRNTNPYPADYYLHKWWDLGWLECHPDDFGIEKDTNFSS